MRMFAILGLLLLVGISCVGGINSRANSEQPLARGDLIEVTWLSTFNSRDTVAERLRVDERGQIYMPWNGSFEVAGLIPNQVAAKVPAIHPQCLTSPDFTATVSIIERNRSLEILSPYKPGDTLQIRIHDLMAVGEVETITTPIAPNGTVTLPLAGPVNLVGLSDATAPKAIADVYSEKKVMNKALAFVLKTSSAK